MSIGGQGFEVGIEAFSKTLAENIFMKIEEPEHPIPVKTLAVEAAVPDIATIGQFYEALKDKIAEFGNSIFKVGSDHQVLHWFGPARLFPRHHELCFGEQGHRYHRRRGRRNRDRPVSIARQSRALLQVRRDRSWPQDRQDRGWFRRTGAMSFRSTPRASFR